jgi:hypothetical protein
MALSKNIIKKKKHLPFYALSHPLFTVLPKGADNLPFLSNKKLFGAPPYNEIEPIGFDTS